MNFDNFYVINHFSRREKGNIICDGLALQSSKKTLFYTVIVDPFDGPYDSGGALYAKKGAFLLLDMKIDQIFSVFFNFRNIISEGNSTIDDVKKIEEVLDIAHLDNKYVIDFSSASAFGSSMYINGINNNFSVKTVDNGKISIENLPN